MTCPHNFAAWQHETLAKLATEQYEMIMQLKYDLDVLRQAYRLEVAENAELLKCS